MTHWLPCGCSQADGTPDPSCKSCRGRGLREATAEEIATFQQQARDSGSSQCCEVCDSQTTSLAFARVGRQRLYLCPACESRQDDSDFVDSLGLDG